MEANLDASISLLPNRSQIFVVLLSLLSGLAFAVGCLFLWYEKPVSWVPFLFALFFGIPAGLAWFLSHKNTDLDGAHPTRVQFTSNGLQVETDSRTLASRVSFQQLEKMIGLIGHRAPLPEPDGLVSSNGLPMPEGKAEAIERVQRANEEAEQATLKAVRFLCNVNEIAGASVSEQLPMQVPENISSISRNAPDA